MNTKTIKAVVGVVAMLAGTVSVQAADWEMAGRTAQQVAVYVDGGSIERAGSGVVRLTALEDFGKVEYLGEPVYPHRSRQTTFRVDCGVREVGYESWVLYEGARGSGGVVWSAESEGGVGMFRPMKGSSHERVLERACGGPVVAAAE
jgi:hypothetical protein